MAFSCTSGALAFVARPGGFAARQVDRLFADQGSSAQAPKQKELDERSWQNSVDLVIDQWLLLEFACTFLPAQQNAVVEAMSKSQVQIPDEFLKAMELDPDFFRRPGVGAARADDPVTVASFTPLEEIEKALCNRIAALDLRALAARAAQELLDRHRSRI